MKRIISLSFVVCIVFALAGCGSNQKDAFDIDFLLDTVTAQQVMDRYGNPFDTFNVYNEDGTIITDVGSTYGYIFNYYDLAFQGYMGFASFVFETDSESNAPINFDINKLISASWEFDKGTLSVAEYERAVKKIVKAIKTIDVMKTLKEHGYSSTRLRDEKLMGQSYLQQLRRGEMVSWKTIDLLCRLLECQVGDLIEYVADAPTGEQ